MPINPFIEQGAFGPEATAAMGEAFDAACNELLAVGQLQVVRKLLAQRIIVAARKGELDPVHLRAAALSGLPLTKMAPRSLEAPSYIALIPLPAEASQQVSLGASDNAAMPRISSSTTSMLSKDSISRRILSKSSG